MNVRRNQRLATISLNRPSTEHEMKKKKRPKKKKNEVAMNRCLSIAEKEEGKKM